MATLKEIARAARVSITTAGDVLNQKARARRVSDATARRVLKAAERLGYRPNLHARALVQKRTYLVGAVSASVHTSFFGGITAGFLRKLESSGFRVLFSCSGGSTREAEKAFAEMVRSGAEGVAFIGGAIPFGKRPPVPVAATHRASIRAGISAVTVDAAAGGRAAAAHLSALGRRKIVLVGKEIDGRMKAAAAACRTAGGKVVWGAPEELPGFVRRGATGAFCATDYLAVQALGELREAGLTVPRDCALVGYDDLTFAALTRPTLTTVRQPKETYGLVLAELLLERINGGKPRRVVLQPELAVRESTVGRATQKGETL